MLAKILNENAVSYNVTKLAIEHAKNLAFLADEDFEKKITAGIINPIGFSDTRKPLLRNRKNIQL